MVSKITVAIYFTEQYFTFYSNCTDTAAKIMKNYLNYCKNCKFTDWDLFLCNFTVIFAVISVEYSKITMTVSLKIHFRVYSYNFTITYVGTYTATAAEIRLLKLLKLM